MEKAHILDEIRRTAQENGGVPLGRRAFYNATGIRDADWHGKFWARWGDAVRESGFVPNEKNTAYAADFLLEKYLALTREIGHFPTAGELKLKARQDPSFPSHNTFARLGNKPGIVARVQQYAERRSGFEDVLKLCSDSASAGEDKPKTTQAGPETNGFVYLIKSGRFYKIGKTNSAGRRSYELAIQLPEPAKPVHIIATDDPAGIEVYWHTRFDAQRKNGEWFELTAEQVNAFKRRKFM